MTASTSPPPAAQARLHCGEMLSSPRAIRPNPPNAVTKLDNGDRRQRWQPHFGVVDAEIRAGARVGMHGVDVNWNVVPADVQVYARQVKTRQMKAVRGAAQQHHRRVQHAHA